MLMLKKDWDGYFQVSCGFREAVCNYERALDCLIENGFSPAL